MERVFSGVSSVRFGRIELALVDELRGTGDVTSVFAGQIPDRVARIDGAPAGHCMAVAASRASSCFAPVSAQRRSWLSAGSLIIMVFTLVGVDGVDPDVAQSPPSDTLRQYSQDEQETTTSLHTAAAKAWFTSCQCPSKLHCS
jgi:hypothetical protein